MTTKKLKRKIKIDGGEEIAPPSDMWIDNGDIREFPIPSLKPQLSVMVAELQDMTDVLLGRSQAPVNDGVATLLEVADAYFGRASEMTMMLQRAEREGHIKRGDQMYRFRTGELRTFLDMAKRCAETGSRRLTSAQMRFEASKRGLESEFDDDDVHVPGANF